MCFKAALCALWTVGRVGRTPYALLLPSAYAKCTCGLSQPLTAQTHSTLYTYLFVYLLKKIVTLLCLLPVAPESSSYRVCFFIYCRAGFPAYVHSHAILWVSVIALCSVGVDKMVAEEWFGRHRSSAAHPTFLVAPFPLAPLLRCGRQGLSTTSALRDSVALTRLKGSGCPRHRHSVARRL